MLTYLDKKSLAPCFGLLLLLAHYNTHTALSSFSSATIRCSSHSLACTFVFVFVFVAAAAVVRFRTLALALLLLLGCRFVC